MFNSVKIFCDNFCSQALRGLTSYELVAEERSDLFCCRELVETTMSKGHISGEQIDGFFYYCHPIKLLHILLAFKNFEVKELRKEKTKFYLSSIFFFTF